ncbi:MAG TPA: acetyl-CoA carboxylase biotin carboxylase subunit [Spirochaetota bacterium]|nr:acetyl-CoA carboxylase biotin carboxylase subunit [Spirochaetota bacterium]HOM38242.1 acetyl-CoA carboxylase biotin carboxylase subunit [Spirochaetota bacterium]HPQ48540.1 acetyl-CoA carboxylase biotin carboxylase subunit [Spirochaetota bacterium]
MPFKKVLIANRGEIALRAIRACRELGIKTVIVYSTADKESMPVKLADEKICIGGPKSVESYLNISQIIAAAEVTGSDAIYPGYGFLSENATFSEICKSHNITFIGPSKEVIDMMGDKATARETMQKAGVPIVPGSGILATEKDAIEAANRIGYPVLIKATAGGGGRGMRVCENEKELITNYNQARQEAKQAFGNPDVYMEKFIRNPKHIEVQVLGDSHGQAFHLFERECSIQRRHQKLIEEATSPALDDEKRKKLTDAAIKGIKNIGYVGAGTMEFIYDQDTKEFYFIEMNTRIQVEHPISEEITKIDLVKNQIIAAIGEKLPLKQEEIKIQGHAIECRINAEDPDKDFLPNPGKIDFLFIPGGFGIRVDTHIYSGYTLPSFYDSMLAKLIVWGPTREEAIKRMKRALSEFIIEGIKTTIPFHMKVMDNPVFIEGTHTTRFIDSLKGK